MSSSWSGRLRRGVPTGGAQATWNRQVKGMGNLSLTLKLPQGTFSKKDRLTPGDVSKLFGGVLKGRNDD